MPRRPLATSGHLERVLGLRTFRGFQEMTPDELVEVLEERIQWVKAHKKAVERYLQKQGGSRWLRVVGGSVTESKDPSGE